MSGGACVIIIDDGEQLKAVSNSLQALMTLEMQQMLTFPVGAVEKAHSDLLTVLAQAQAIKDELYAAVGDPPLNAAGFMTVNEARNALEPK